MTGETPIEPQARSGTQATGGNPLRLDVHIDGGARGNPGPAAAAVVVRDSADGAVLQQRGVFLGEATNNVAEYRALLLGLELAAKLRAAEVAIFSDSQLLVRQMQGKYRVRNAGLKPLHEQALQMSDGFTRCSFHHVRREENQDADRLVQEAINLKRNVEDAPG
jgi:ribonuclease HI